MNDLSLHIIDIVQNSISAGATLITIYVDENIIANLLTIKIIDNGKGMTREQVDKLADPFFTSRTTRRVGLGIPLFKQSAEQSGGSLNINSILGVGTTVTATFIPSNIDCPPLGDVSNAVVLLASANPLIDFMFEYTFNGKQYCFDTREVKDILDGLSINNPSIVKYLEEMIKENINELKKC